jgi:hypothetical protein
LRKSANTTASAAEEGIVPAGVEDDDSQTGFAGLQFFKENVGGIGLMFGLGFISRSKVHWNEVVFAAKFHPVAGVVKQSDIANTDSFDKGVNRTFKGNDVQVLAGLNLEAEVTKSSGYSPCIVDSVRQRSRSGIVRIADYQGVAMRRRRVVDYDTADGGLRLT